MCLYLQAGGRGEVLELNRNARSNKIFVQAVIRFTFHNLSTAAALARTTSAVSVNVSNINLRRQLWLLRFSLRGK